MKKTILLVTLAAGAVFASDTPSGETLQGWLNQQINAGVRNLSIPKGIYRLKPQEIAHLEFQGLNNVTIDFQGSEIVCTDHTRAIDLVDCQNTVLKNLVIDYDPKLYTQGRLTAVTPKHFEMDVFGGYPVDGLDPHYGDVFDATTRELKCGSRTFYDLERVEHLGGRKLRIHRKRSLSDVDGFVKVGDLLIMKRERKRADGGRFGPHAVLSANCRNMRFENITVYASPTFSFCGQSCSNLHYYRCRVDRRQDDPTVESPRLMAGNWDGFHSINAEVGPTIEECYAKYMGDDPVNIRGDYQIVMESNGPELTVLAKHSINIQLGDPVEILERDGSLIARAVAQKLEPLPDYPRATIEKVRKKFTLIYPGICHDVWKLTLDKPVEIKDVSVICSLNRIGNGFKVINNVFGNNRSRGVLTKASNGLIAGNVIENCGMESLKLSPNIMNWLEAAYYENLVVSNNIIRNGKFMHHFGNNIPAQILIAGCRKELVFTGNTIEYSGEPAMIVSNLDGGIIRDNTFKRLDGPTPENPIIFDNCQNLETR